MTLKYGITFILLIMFLKVDAQKFKTSTTYNLTELDHDKIFSNKDTTDQFIYIINENKSKIAKIAVYAETYENDSKVEESTGIKLKNISKVIKTKVYQCACYCDIETFYWLITNKKKWIKLPVIADDDYELNATYKKYIFDINEPNTIKLAQFKDKFNEETQEYSLASKTILKTYTWNGNEIIKN